MATVIFFLFHHICIGYELYSQIIHFTYLLIQIRKSYSFNILENIVGIICNFVKCKCHDNLYFHTQGLYMLLIYIIKIISQKQKSFQTQTFFLINAQIQQVL